MDLEQQVDFFMVLGQQEAAVDLLVGHIRNTGGTSPVAYLKLLEIYAALARAGLVAVPVNFRLKGPEVDYIVRHSEAQAFIVQEDLRALVEGIRADLPLASSRYVLFGAPAPQGWQGYEDLMAAASPEAPAVEVRPQDLFAQIGRAHV